MQSQTIKIRQYNNTFNNTNKPHFKGIMDSATWALKTCAQYPMINVSAIDTVTAIAPRTAMDARTNIFAAFETFRRESSGLLVNCLLPSFFVLGIAKVIQNFIFKDKNLNMASVWADGNTIENLAKFYQDAAGLTKDEKVRNYITNLLNSTTATSGKDSIRVIHSQEVIDLLSEAILNPTDSNKKNVKTAYDLIVKDTHAAEIIDINGKRIDGNLSKLLDDAVSLGKRFKLDNVASNLESFSKKAISLVNKKSALGFAVIIPLAMSMQTINRWITKYVSGSEGAPIYSDFGSESFKKREPKKENLFFHKLAACSAMLGVALASMAKLPTQAMFQFKGMFPTMDQCRWISAATFGSRMLAAEDKNELRETTIRDIATFASFYWLGDYASKGLATIFEKINKDVKLLNYRKVLDDKAPLHKKIFNWIKDVDLKSFDEVAHNKRLTNLRTGCQLTSFAFSTILLGFLIPWYTRKQTEKNENLLKLANKPTLNLVSGRNLNISRLELPTTFKKFIQPN